MARFYADENFPLPVVDVLLRLGHNVFTIFQDGKDRQQYPDELVLATATAYQRAVLTMNRKPSCGYTKFHRDMAASFSAPTTLILLIKPS